MDKIEKVYKVVQVHCTNSNTNKTIFESCCAYGKLFECHYEMNKETKPKIGSLFAFKKLSDAESFAKRAIIMPVILQGYGIVSSVQLDDFPSIRSTQTFKKNFWLNKINISLFDIYSKKIIKKPNGTILIDNFIPKKQIYKH